VLTVADTGTGMDLDTQRRIFEPFFTTKVSGKGTGLGMAIVQSLVQRSHGRIVLESSPGEGTSFHLYFPQHELQPEEQPSARAFSTPAPETRILIVDDDDGVRNVATRILERQGYQVLGASSTAGALELFSNVHSKIDLVLTDIRMPETSGPQLVERFRQRRPDLPVLFMSGDAAIPDGDPHVGKPFTPKELLAGVQNVLARNP